ncbi:TPA: hypothetical protein N0F65_011134 [Lagenidium giganteum]|uniref:Uncharacterized protein n=1 Tax=Lagenidium giganteum TaxID=4803 RepID=A0AAV2ZAX8_9STRA|nr:TPA: hypothetical protein N0F65_011134 [Lagenidium giganteum]
MDMPPRHHRAILLFLDNSVVCEPYPVPGHTPAKISIGDQIEARLREEIPRLQFDILVLTAQYRCTTNFFTIVPCGFNAASFRAPGLEIKALIRGQLCVQGDCVTQIIDDYRYERMYTSVSNRTRRKLLLMTALLRGFARVDAGFGAKAAAAWRLFFRIPVHVVVYGSWPPVLAYAVAHYIDCGLLHMWFFALWSTMNGEWTFDLSAYVSACATQMRNAWIIGVTISALVFILRSVLGVRGGAALYSSGIVRRESACPQHPKQHSAQEHRFRAIVFGILFP